MKFEIAPKAEDDLRESYEFIARDNLAAADRWLAGIAETLGLIATGIVSGRETVLKSGRKVRAWSRPPYRIYYRIKDDAVQIVRVYHQARRPIEK